MTPTAGSSSVVATPQATPSSSTSDAPLADLLGEPDDVVREAPDREQAELVAAQPRREGPRALTDAAALSSPAKVMRAESPAMWPQPVVDRA